MRTLNLGILAHVDAGKTTLTERLLHHAGVIDEVGRVDHGTTHTDFLDLERQRGITIKAAVVSFVLGDTRVNLIDTPGHPDFIAEVERTLSVLDGAVLVLSAVEGVQAQTRVLMRALQRLRVPTLLFVNKIDRVGARHDDLVREMADKLAPSIVVMGTPVELGTRDAQLVPLTPDEMDLAGAADHDERLLAMLVEDGGLDPGAVIATITRLSRRGKVYPVLFGSALVGTGIDVLAEAICQLLPARRGEQDGDDGRPSGQVFKIERGPSGDRAAFVRMFRGSVNVRDRIDDNVVTNIEVFHNGGTERRSRAVAGEIAKVWGLGGIQIGDVIGHRPTGAGRRTTHRFAPPTLETVVVPQAGDRVAAVAALTQLADQDPLIGFRHDETTSELRLSLYGEVQKQVIEATLATEYGVTVEFRESTPLCIERVVSSGQAIERMPRGGRSASRPFLAGVGLRIDPAPVGAGVRYNAESRLGALPASFHEAIAGAVTDTLRQGLCGWAVTDCTITLTASQYAPRQSHAHQGFSKAMSSIGSDFRFLTPLVLMAALQRAGTKVCEPVHRFELEIPTDVLATMVPLLGRLDAPPLEQESRGTVTILTGIVRAADIHTLQQHIPDLTRGEGVLVTAFDSYRPVRGAPPTRARADFNPLNRREYLLRVSGAVAPKSSD